MSEAPFELNLELVKEFWRLKCSFIPRSEHVIPSSSLNHALSAGVEH